MVDLGESDATSRLRRWPSIPRPVTIGSILLVLFVWQLFSLRFSASQFPGLLELAENLAIVVTGKDRFEPLPHFGATLVRVAVGFGLAFSLATAWGVIMGLRRTIGEYLAGPLFVFLTVPSVVWAFVGVVWFGLTEFLVPVFVIVAIVFPYLTVTIWKGIESIDERLLAMGRSVGATEPMLWRHLYLPHLRPYLVGAARVGIAVSWKVALVAEVFGTASGVGVVAKFHFEAFDTGMVIAWAIPIMVLIYVIDRIVLRFERSTLVWRREAPRPIEVIG